MNILRVFPTASLDGPTQMARDEAMMLSSERGRASFRFYTWSEPTLSLGYFQSASERLDDPLLSQLPFVRRPSGGGAIVHDHELTYALALPAGKEWQSDEIWTCRFHHLLVRAFRKLGIESRPVICGEEKKLGPFLCFQHHTPGDLVIGTDKIVGSAQRRPRGGTIQHGSILLNRSDFAPSLPGITDLTGVSLDSMLLQATILAELQADTGWIFEGFNWTESELREVDRILREKYSAKEWNEKR
jgi:lipoate-protein ligase A